MERCERTRHPSVIDSQRGRFVPSNDLKADSLFSEENSLIRRLNSLKSLNNEDDSQDAVQEAFGSAFRALNKFNGDAMLSTWLHRIVVNAALVQLRSKRRRGEQPLEKLLPRFNQVGEWIGDPVTWTDTAETILERRDSREMARRCIERLPEKYRSVLLLRDIEELDTDEAALSLAVSANTFKVRSIWPARHSRLSSSESLYSGRLVRTIHSPSLNEAFVRRR